MPGATSDGQSKGLISVRPEDVRLTPEGEGHIPGRVTFVRDLGGSLSVHNDAQGAVFELHMPAAESPGAE